MQKRFSAVNNVRCVAITGLAMNATDNNTFKCKRNASFHLSTVFVFSHNITFFKWQPILYNNQLLGIVELSSGWFIFKEINSSLHLWDPIIAILYKSYFLFWSFVELLRIFLCSVYSMCSHILIGLIDKLKYVINMQSRH